MDENEHAPGAEPAAGGDEGGTRLQRILVVDDEMDILESLKDLLVASIDNVEVRTAISGAEGIKVLEQESVDLIITDYKMPGMNGLEFLEKSKDMAPKAPRILVTAFPDLQIAIRAINEAGINNFFTKPFDPGKVIEVVNEMLSSRRKDTMRNQSFARSLDVLRRRMGGDDAP